MTACLVQELDRLDADANIFKLIGPALIKQDLVEASSNVGKRLEYIKSEIERTEGQIKSLQTKMGDKEKEVRVHTSTARSLMLTCQHPAAAYHSCALLSCANGCIWCITLCLLLLANDTHLCAHGP